MNVLSSHTFSAFEISYVWFQNIVVMLSKRYEYFHSFCESLYKRTVLEVKLRGIFVILFFGFTQFTLLVHKSIIIFLQNFEKIPLGSAINISYTIFCHNEQAKWIIINERSGWISFHMPKLQKCILAVNSTRSVEVVENSALSQIFGNLFNLWYL